jgi:hypothetical protein
MAEERDGQLEGAELFEIDELDDKDLEGVAGGGLSTNESCTNGSCGSSTNTGGCSNTTCGEEIST